MKRFRQGKPWTAKRVAANVAAVLHRQGRQGGVIFPEGLHAVAREDSADITVVVGYRTFKLTVEDITDQLPVPPLDSSESRTVRAYADAFGQRVPPTDAP
jgi:hypothetical protein